MIGVVGLELPKAKPKSAGGGAAKRESAPGSPHVMSRQVSATSSPEHRPAASNNRGRLVRSNSGTALTELNLGEMGTYQSHETIG